MKKDYSHIKVHNAQRILKKTKERQSATGNHNTPPKYFDRNYIYTAYSRMQAKLGYDYQCQESKTMKWMKEDFEDKMKKYLSNGEIAHKKSRMDKVKMKEKLGFKVEVNPLITIFSRVNRKIEKGMLWDGFSGIKR